VFSPDEHRKAAPLSNVVIGYALWRRAYGGDPKILGRKITLVGIPSTVIGVMPPGFAFPEGTELWFSKRALGEGAGRAAHNFRVIGRLRPGVAVEAAQPADVFMLVLRRALVLVAAGTALGAGACLALGGVLQKWCTVWRQEPGGARGCAGDHGGGRGGGVLLPGATGDVGGPAQRATYGVEELA
jgi:hypothetical protein